MLKKILCSLLGIIILAFVAASFIKIPAPTTSATVDVPITAGSPHG